MTESDLEQLALSWFQNAGRDGPAGTAICATPDVQP